MAGTHAGGMKALDTNQKLYGEDFYKRIGSMGGSVCCAKGFATSHERAVEAGRKGGKISRRTKKTED
jgi:uncharacterized protein